MKEATISDVLAAIAEGNQKHIVMYPVYESTGNTYKVTVHDAKGTTVSDSLAEGSGFTVTAASPDDGSVFQYWSDKENGGSILSYDVNYFVLVSQDVDLYAVYGNAEISNEPIIAMTNWYTRDDISTGKSYLCFEATRDVPQEYTVIQHGVLYTTNSTVGTETELVLNGGTDVNEIRAKENTNRGVYTANFNMTVQLDKIIYARGYIVVQKDNELAVYYTPVVFGAYSSMTTP